MPRSRLGEALEEVLEELGARPARPDLPALEVGHRRRGLGGQRAGGAGVQVDAGADGRERLSDRGHLLGIGHERADHGRMIAAMASPSADRSSTPSRPMTGLARPELLASTEWLADQLGRPEVRILDVRWRPDGSGRATHAAGHIPGAVHLDWRADLIDPSDTGDALLLAGPEQVANALAAAGVSDGATVDHLRRHRVAVRGPDLVEHPGLRPRVGADPRRRLSARGSRRAGRSRTRSCRRRRAGSRRGPSRGCGSRRPTCASLLGSPGRGAPRRARAGRVPRVRGQHEAARPHPRRVERARRGDDAAGQPALPRRQRAPRHAAEGERRRAAGGWSATTARASPRRSSRSR